MGKRQRLWIAALLVLGATFFFWPSPATKTAQLEHSPDAQEEAQRREPAVFDAGSGYVGSARESVRENASAPALRVLVRNALDGAPVASLPIVVYQELDFGLSREFAHATTDAQGRAQFERLEGELVVVATRRQPPFACGFGAAQLVRGKTSVVEIPLRGGGTVRGRVVDGAHQPIAGAEILLGCDGPPGGVAPQRVLEWTQVAARSSDDGRFELACIAPSPSGITLESGALKAREWPPELLYARKDGLGASALARVQDSETLDLGDLVIEGNNCFAGVVLDAGELPVAGALVSLQSGREYAREWPLTGPFAQLAAGPGQPGFVLAEGEMLSDSSGRFELQGKSDQITVWTSAGQLQTFALPKLAPGVAKRDLVLRLERRARLEIELVNSAGERVRAESPLAGQPELHTYWRKGSPTHGLCGDFQFTVGDPLREHLQCDPDGLWRFDLPAERGELRALELRLGGYVCVRDTLAGRDVGRLRYTIEELPVVRVRLHATDAAQLGASGGGSLPLNVQVCLADPARRTQAPSLGACCGRGSNFGFLWTGEDRGLALLAGERRSYWVYLRGTKDLASFGPFAADGEEHEIPISFLELRALLNASSAPAPGGQALERVAPATLSARVVDASGAALAQPAFGFERIEGAAGLPFHLYPQAGEDGQLRIDEAPVGVWRLHVSAPGHAEQVLERVVVEPGKKTDLGTIALQSRPTFRGRLLHADGSPAAHGNLGAAITRFLKPRAETDADGRFTLDADLPADFLLLVHEGGLAGGHSWSTQSLRVERWEPGVEQAVYLRPWRTFEVRVGGPAAEMPESNFVLRVRPAPGAETPEDSNAYAVPLDAGVDAGRRVFRLALVEGRYEIEGGGLLATIPVTSIEVRASDEPQAIELVSR